MDYKDLQTDAIYRLSEDVKNPHSDGRYKRQPNMEKVWKKGTRFIAREEVFEHCYEGVDVRVTWFKLEWVDREHGSIYGIPIHEKKMDKEISRRQQAATEICGQTNVSVNQAIAIMAVLEPTEEDFKAFTTRIGMSDYSMREVMKRLCLNGTITHEQIEDEYYAWLNPGTPRKESA